MTAAPHAATETAPLVSVVQLSYNRRDALRESIVRMREESGYPRDRLELIVVDNASDDGTRDMIREKFSGVRLVEHGRNLGAPGLNAGFALATGDYVLILDDDAYLPRGALSRAVQAAEREGADLVSFTVVSSEDPGHRFNDEYATGLLSFWGTAALVSRRAMRELGGYDPNLFLWANELEFTMRLLDRGFRHLHLPDVAAVHMKPGHDGSFVLHRHRVNARHYGYIAGKLMRPRDAAAVLGAQVAGSLVQSAADDATAAVSLRDLAAGLALGVRHRAPVRPEVSRAYRRHFRAFAPPWPFSRTPGERWRARRDGAVADRQRARRQAAWRVRHARFYPTARASLTL